MHTDTLAAELLQLSTTTHAWHQRHRGDAISDAMGELRPALEAFCRGATARHLDAAGVRRLATTAVRIAVAPDASDGTRDALVREVGAMLDGICASAPADPRAERVVSEGLARAPRAD
jgi:hypothetical protein